MKYSYCTLFDSNYLDKGIVMLKSLRASGTNSAVYVLAMDEICCRVLNSIKMENVIVITLENFLNEELAECRKNRSGAEFCWTCTASLISYVFEIYQEKICTYIDADLYFYSNPDRLVVTMLREGKSVQIIGHNFRNTFSNRRLEQYVGKYCVQFNTFCNDRQGRKVLNDWRKQTIKKCSSDLAQGYGDQFYLNDWMERYPCIAEVKNKGAGVAPWNIDRFRLISVKDGHIYVSAERTKAKLYFYHFHDMEYVDKQTVNIKVHVRHWHVDERLVRIQYMRYLKEIDVVKNELENNYGIKTLIDVHPKDKYKKNRKNHERRSLTDFIVWMEQAVKHKLWKNRDIYKI